jgi:succinyl-CoA synthetase beta subunit
MKLKEYEAKEIFENAGIPIPRGIVVKKGDDFLVSPDIEEAVVKAQVEVAGRGKAGGILVADYSRIPETAQKLFQTTIAGMPVEEVLIEERLQIEHEYYLSITIDRSKKAPVILFTSEGGVEIEEVARTIRRLFAKRQCILFFQRFLAIPYGICSMVRQKRSERSSRNFTRFSLRKMHCLPRSILLL